MPRYRTPTGTAVTAGVILILLYLVVYAACIVGAIGLIVLALNIFGVL